MNEGVDFDQTKMKSPTEEGTKLIFILVTLTIFSRSKVVVEL